MTALKKDNEAYQAIAKYLKDSLDFDTISVHYAGTQSNNGLTQIIHYDIRVSFEGKPVSKFRATVYWNNDVPANQLPTITRMDVI